MCAVTDMAHNNLASLPDSGEVIKRLLVLQKQPVNNGTPKKRSVKYVLNDKGRVVFVHNTTKKLRVKVRVKRQKTSRQILKKTKTFRRNLYPRRKIKC